MFTPRSLTVHDHSPVRTNLMVTFRSLTMVAELFAAAVLVIWIAAGCVILATNGAPF